jgi:hypothetical protein
MHGSGVYTARDGSIYTGSFSDGKKNGSGKINMHSGDVYEGEWESDRYNGIGIMWYGNGNAYEGHFVRGSKEGPGKFYYRSTGKIYEGEWVDDAPRCGAFRDATEEELHKFRSQASTVPALESFQLPQLELSDARHVLTQAITETRRGRMAERHLVPSEDTTLVQPVEENESKEVSIAKAEQLFCTLDVANEGVVRLCELLPVFALLGAQLSSSDLGSIASQLEITIETKLAFTEIVDISSFLTGA